MTPTADRAHLETVGAVSLPAAARGLGEDRPALGSVQEPTGSSTTAGESRLEPGTELETYSSGGLGMTRQVFAAIARAPQVTFAKRTVLRRESPFEIDLGEYGAADYEKIIPSLRDVEQRLMTVPADAQGLRWIHLSDTVLFYGERTFDVLYEDFVSRVDISHAGQFYRDSLSVATEVVTRDGLGRPVRQGVRVVALPQPNYASFFGKGNLDVYKLEKIDYGEDEQRVWMLTVHSPNGSAVCDDGYMSFRRSSDGSGTVVAFLACQNFPIPPLMALARIDQWTWFKTLITESAYRHFCNTMMKNILDCYHGKDFHVGRPVS